MSSRSTYTRASPRAQPGPEPVPQVDQHERLLARPRGVVQQGREAAAGLGDACRFHATSRPRSTGQVEEEVVEPRAEDALVLDQHAPVARVGAGADEALLEQGHQGVALGVLQAALVALEQRDRSPSLEDLGIEVRIDADARSSVSVSTLMRRVSLSRRRGRAGRAGDGEGAPRSVGADGGERLDGVLGLPAHGRRRGAAGRRSRPAGAATARGRRRARRASRPEAGSPARRRGARAATTSCGPPCAIRSASETGGASSGSAGLMRSGSTSSAGS